MKNTGIVRPVDDLGRVVLPIEIRRVLEIKEKDPLEIWFEPEQKVIVLTPYRITCTFCGAEHDLVELRGRKVCRRCIKEAVKME